MCGFPRLARHCLSAARLPAPRGQRRSSRGRGPGLVPQGSPPDPSVVRPRGASPGGPRGRPGRGEALPHDEEPRQVRPGQATAAGLPGTGHAESTCPAEVTWRDLPPTHTPRLPRHRPQQRTAREHRPALPHTVRVPPQPGGPEKPSPPRAASGGGGQSVTRGPGRVLGIGMEDGPQLIKSCLSIGLFLVTHVSPSCEPLGAVLRF